MNRREMILGLISALGLSGTQILVSCGKATAAADLTTTSTAVGHTHQFTITAAELAAPVAIDRNDSASGGHAHRVQLSLSEVTNIAAGTAVVRQSDSADGHQHSYTFQKV